MTSLANLILRLGNYHIVDNFLDAIGYFMKESRIEDV